MGMDRPRNENAAPKRRRLQALSAACVLLVAGAAYGVSRLTTGTLHVDRNVVVVDTVRRGEFIHEVRAPGVLLPRDVRWLVAQSNARVQRILQRPGAIVAIDTIIVELTNPELETELQEAAFALAQGEAQIAALRMQLASQVLDQKAHLSEVRSNYRGASLQADAESDAALAQAVSALQAKRSRLLAEQLGERVNVEEERLVSLRASIAAQVRAEAARLSSLRATLERQRTLMAALTVRAGMNGVLQSLSVQVGQQTAVGVQIARIAAPDDLMAELRVPELDARELRVGLTARVDLHNGHVATGQVARVDPGVESGTVKVEINFSGVLPGGARPDLSVEGVIEIERIKDALFVGRMANGQPESKLTIFRLSSDGRRAFRVPVTVGKTSMREVLVNNGLAVGDRVITSDTSQWSSRDELRID